MAGPALTESILAALSAQSRDGAPGAELAAWPMLDSLQTCSLSLMPGQQGQSHEQPGAP